MTCIVIVSLLLGGRTILIYISLPFTYLSKGEGVRGQGDGHSDERPCTHGQGVQNETQNGGGEDRQQRPSLQTKEP